MNIRHRAPPCQRTNEIAGRHYSDLSGFPILSSSETADINTIICNRRRTDVFRIRRLNGTVRTRQI
jgi:hypothetical protein